MPNKGCTERIWKHGNSSVQGDRRKDIYSGAREVNPRATGSHRNSPVMHQRKSLQLAKPMASPRARAPDALVTPHDFSGECTDCSTFA